MSHTADIWVIVEQNRGEVKGVSFEALNAARGLSGETGGSVVAVALCDEPGQMEKTLAESGADQIRIYTHPSLNEYNPLTLREVLTPIIAKEPPFCVIMGATNHGKELIPALATATGSGCITDCILLSKEGDSLIVKRPVYSGKAVSILKFMEKAPFFITIRPNLFRGQTATSTSPEVIVEALDLPDKGSRLKLVERKVEGGKRDITEAQVVVSGGMGMQSPDNFKMLEDLADSLHGAVGASRPVVDEGWRPYSNQVGQTGRTVSPNLYIACGISGAVQHLAGMSSSQCIVAINKDGDAPIYDLADFGIVGDALEIVPVLTEEIRKVIQS